MSELDPEARLDRLEAAVAELGGLLESEPTDEPVELPAVDEIMEDVDNKPDEDGITPRMVRDWGVMQAEMISSGRAVDAADADEKLGRFFDMIASGEIVVDEVPAP